MRHQLLLSSDIATPLGRLRLSGKIWQGHGVSTHAPLRVYGSYAVVCVLHGTGTYRDARNFRASVHAGQAILVFPELAHWYGPRPGDTWDELYLTFDGAAFDLWRASGLLSQEQPVRLYPDGFAERLEAFALRASQDSKQRAHHIAELLALLGELPRSPGTPGTPDTLAPTHLPTSSFVALAQAALETDLATQINLAALAAGLGVGYETFRKRFERETGVSPARFRAQKRIEAAKALLRFSPQMTNRQVSATLGFADEYHFSRRFTQTVGVSPRAFRAANFAAKESKWMSNTENAVSVRLLNFSNADDRGALYDLRLRILRPNRPASAGVFPGDEDEQTVHIGAFTPQGRCVGIATLVPNNGFQLRGMAVESELQGQNIGTHILHLLHETARERGIREIWCNARVRAVPFYEKNGWVAEGDEFEVPDVGPHFVMRRTIE